MLSAAIVPLAGVNVEFCRAMCTDKLQIEKKKSFFFLLRRNFAFNENEKMHKSSGWESVTRMMFTILSTLLDHGRRTSVASLLALVFN